MTRERIDLTQFEHDNQKFYRYLEEQDLPNNNWFIGTERPKTAYDFQKHVKEAYGNGALTGTQGDYCCLVKVGDYDAIVTLAWSNCIDSWQEYYLCIEEIVPSPTATKRDLIAELKRCYDLIDCLEDEMEFVLQQLHRPIMGGLEWYEVRNNILNQLVTNANSSTIQVLEALEHQASE